MFQELLFPSGRVEKDYIRLVPLLSNTTISAPIKSIYYILLISLMVFGGVEIFIQNTKDEKKINLCKICSILLHALTITFFAMSQQPYVTVFLFMLFMVKVVLPIKKSGMK